MEPLCWMTVSLAVLLSAGNCLAVDQNQLGYIVHHICTNYRPSYSIQDGKKYPMFSLVVSIPFNEQIKKYDVNQVLNSDRKDEVISDMLACEVYVGNRVVGATVLRWPNVLDQCPDGRVQWLIARNRCPSGFNTWADVKNRCPPDAIYEGRADHAEYRTLKNSNTLLNRNNETDLYLIYVFASPCGSRCANENNRANILQFLEPFGNMTNRVFVFSKVFKPFNGDTIPEDELKGALQALGGKIGLENVFRCDYRDHRMTCTSCSSGGDVTPQCYQG